MNRKVSGVIGVAFGTVALAVVTGQQTSAAQSQSASADKQSSAGTVTVTGCVQREADYRKAAGASKGGLGTGAGTSNEYVLTNAMMSTGAGAAPTTGAGGAPSATGTAGSASNITYQLTGSNEGQASAFVGKKVEIMGKMKTTDLGANTTQAVTADNLKLRELEVSSIREASGTCAPLTPAP